jgi:hypothetical protein
MDRPEGFGTAALQPEFEAGQPLIWKSTENGLATNVRWQVRHHSPDGLSIGHTGNGPSDLALNAMEALFPKGEKMQCLDGAVTQRAWDLHESFKFKFLVAADPQEGQIEWEDIQEWLTQQSDETSGEEK